MKIVLSAILLVTAFFTQAQSYEAKIAEAWQHYTEENYEASAKAYEVAFAMQEADATQYYNAACSRALAGDSSMALAHLRVAAEKGWKDLNHIKTDGDLESLRQLEGWPVVLEQVAENKQEYEKDFDQELKARLEKIYVQDQTLRQLYREAEEKFGRDSEEMNYFWSLMAEEDSASLAAVKEILDEHGWVGKSEVGGKANMTLFLVIQHSPLEVQQQYLPLMKESVEKGESSGRHLALLVDRVRMRNGKPQLYGSQITMDKESGEQVVYDVYKPEYVDQRRAEVGLEPLNEYVKRFGLEWKVEQKTR